MSVKYTYWEWNNSLSLGISAIDSQHRRIVDYINELETARIANDKIGISQVLIGLIDYTMTHFAFEEELMQLGDYPYLNAHRQSHESFTKRINHYVEQHENGVDISRKLLSELKLWLSEHISRDDKHYVPYVKKCITQDWLSNTLAKFSTLNMFSLNN
ncbi:hypothetical protein TI04_06720 [Achromatium sp. WMS2]|nr:hypothetical protein TI04_06720 [Achromatium sp. WMS2]